jgi:tetratricopeptide (TPR) repeat protein
VLVAEQNYESAINEFARAAEISVDDDDSREIVDLAYLALGRLYYETGDMVLSSQHYQRLGRDSKYFSDALYEIVWTFIKQEDYTEAMRAVEIFLLAFPEHRKTAQLKVIQGHLHMKLEQYETALNTYERVITEYTPIQHQLMQIAQDPVEPEQWFERLSRLDVDETYETDEVPTYTVEMLIRDEKFSRIRTSVQEFESQQKGVEVAELLLAEIEASISSLDHLGNYQRARSKLGFLESELLRAQNELLAAEESWLLEYVDVRSLPMIGRLQEQRESLASGTTALREESSTQNEKGQVYEDQVRAVQNYALRIEQEVVATQAEAEALERMLDSGTGGSGLSEGQSQDAKRRLDTVQKEMEAQADELRRLQSDSTRGSVLATVREEAAPQSREQTLSDLSGGYRVLRSQYGKLLVSFIGQDREGFVERVKSAWSRIDSIQRGANQVYNSLRSQETSEMAIVRKKIEEQHRLVAEAREGVDHGGERGDQLAVDITRLGFRELEESFGDKVLEADIGIVDVYWTRKVDVGTELDSLGREQQALLRELNNRFSNVTRGIE